MLYFVSRDCLWPSPHAITTTKPPPLKRLFLKSDLCSERPRRACWTGRDPRSRRSSQESSSVGGQTRLAVIIGSHYGQSSPAVIIRDDHHDDPNRGRDATNGHAPKHGRPVLDTPAPGARKLPGPSDTARHIRARRNIRATIRHRRRHKSMR
jgi:hypothetical protein